MNKKKKILLLFVISFVVFSLFMLLGKNDKCDKKDNAICTVKVEGHKLELTVAYSTEAQMRGLMGVTDLKEGQGMIFVYDTPQVLSFWMKNTLIPLSIAYVKSDGQIAAIQEMYPELGKPDWELKSYPSKEIVKYAIEVPAGWFEKVGVNYSTKIKIPKALR